MLRRVAKLPVRYTIVSCFPRFYGWSLAHKSVSRTFSASHSVAVPIGSEGRKSETGETGEEKRGDREGGRSDEWMKPAVPEARRSRRVILLARVPTTLSSRVYVYTRERAPPVCEGEENPALIAAGEVDW